MNHANCVREVTKVLIFTLFVARWHCPKHNFVCSGDQQECKNKTANQPSQLFCHPNIYDVLPSLKVCDTKFIVIESG